MAAIPSNILIPRLIINHDILMNLIMIWILKLNHLHYICRTRTCSKRGGSISAGWQATEAREWEAKTREWGAKTREWRAKKTTPQESRWDTLTLFVPPPPLPTSFLFSCDNPNVQWFCQFMLLCFPDFISFCAVLCSFYSQSCKQKKERNMLAWVSNLRSNMHTIRAESVPCMCSQ